MLFVQINSYAKYVIANDAILSDKVTNKIESLGSELYTKTGVSAYIAVREIQESILEYEQNLSKNLKSPFVLLTLIKEQQKVDIIHSASLEGKLDKEAVLSPFPWSGTILPLLTQKKSSDKYNAAMLNGYADIVERIADAYGVQLAGAIGNTNKDILHYVKIFILLFVTYIVVMSLWKRKKNR